MNKPKSRIYRTTIVIFTDEPTMVDGDEWDLETLARETVDGGAVCTSQVCVQVQAGEILPERVFTTLGVDELDTSEPEPDDDSDWRSEQAMQAGMMGGCDAYNNAIGSPTDVPAGSRYSGRDDEEG